MSKPARLSPNASGAAGTFFVAAELSRRGYIATLTVRNARGIDLLVANKSATKTVSIQVKTNQDSGKAWMLDSKAEQISSEALFYVFVNLNGQGSPEFHVVEAKTVANHCFRTHRAWLKGPRRDGGARKDTSIREFKDPECVFRGQWRRLGLDD